MALSGAIRAGGAFVEIWAQDGRFQQAMNRVQARLRATAAFMRRIGTEMVMGGTAIGMPMVLAARQAARFEDTLLGMRAAAGLAEADVARLEKEVMRLSVAMGVDPTAISSAFLELTKAGMSVDQVMAGAGRSAVEFARVSGVEMADAAVFMKVAMNTFGVSATQAVDTLSAAADQSETTLQELVQAFALVGSAGVTFDQTLSDLSTGLAVLARYGIRSEEAGTGIKTMLMRLVSPADTAVAALAKMGLTLESFRDTDGNLLPLAQIIDVVARATEGMEKTLRDKLLGDIFGDRAIRIIGAFIDAGVDGFNQMQAAMMESLPVAEKFRILMSGLAGGFQRLYAAVQRLAIAFTAAVGPAFADLIDVSVFALETLGMLAKTFPVLVGRVVMATAALTALGVATILGGFAMGVMARGFAVLTGLAVAAMQPFVLLGRAMVFLSLSALQAGTVVAGAMARMAVAIAAAAAVAIPALLRIAVTMVSLGFSAMLSLGQVLRGLAAAVAGAGVAMVSSIASVMPRVLALIGLSAAELSAAAGVMISALNRLSFGFAAMAARAIASLAALAVAAMGPVLAFAPAAALAIALGVAVAAAATAAAGGVAALMTAVINFGASVVAGVQSAWQAVTGLAQHAAAMGQSAAQAIRQSAAEWGAHLTWMYEQLKAQNFSAIWQAMQLDFQIAMLIVGKHATTAAMFIRGAFDSAASYVSDSMSHALEHIGSMITRLMQQLRLFADYAKLTLLAVMQAAGLISEETLNAAFDAAIEAFAAAEENIAAAQQGADERRATRQQAADARQAEMDAESERFDQEIEQLRSDLADLMKPVEKKDEPPAGPSAVEPTEFREPAGGIGEAGGGSGIGQTQGTFGSSDGLGVGPELNTLRDHAAVAAEKSVEIADNTKRTGDLLGMIADGRLGGLDAAAGLQPALADAAGSPVLAASTQAKMPQLAADSQAGLAQAAQTVQLRVAITTGLDAVTAAVRENTAVTSGQGAQLGSIAAAINTLRGTLV